MPLSDFGLDAATLRESIAPTEQSLRERLGLEVEEAEAGPSYREIVAAGMAATGVDAGSMRGTALLSWADETDNTAAERAAA